MTDSERTVLRDHERATRALQDALTPPEDAAGFAALWRLVREYGDARVALALDVYRSGARQPSAPGGDR